MCTALFIFMENLTCQCYVFGYFEAYEKGKNLLVDRMFTSSKTTYVLTDKASCNDSMEY